MIEVAIVLASALQSTQPEGLPRCTAYSDIVRQGQVSVPEANEERAADVGDPILVSSRYDVRAASPTLADAVVVSGTTSNAPFTLTVPAGTGLALEGPGYRPENYYFEGRGPNPTSVHFEQAADGSVTARIAWGWIKERHLVTTAFEIRRTECVSVPRDSLTRQLAFTGVSRGVVSLEYREFSGDLARPAFTQTATYDLADGSTIGFRGARIEVISADNTEIRYRVLRPLD